MNSHQLQTEFWFHKLESISNKRHEDSQFHCLPLENWSDFFMEIGTFLRKLASLCDTYTPIPNLHCFRLAFSRWQNFGSLLTWCAHNECVMLCRQFNLFCSLISWPYSAFDALLTFFDPKSLCKWHDNIARYSIQSIIITFCLQNLCCLSCSWKYTIYQYIPLFMFLLLCGFFFHSIREVYK